jgi:hypothetical protein
MQIASNPCSNSPPGRYTQKILRWKFIILAPVTSLYSKDFVKWSEYVCNIVHRWEFHPLSKVFIHNGDETHGSELWAREILFEVGHLVSEFLHPRSNFSMTDLGILPNWAIVVYLVMATYDIMFPSWLRIEGDLGLENRCRRHTCL